MNFLGKSCSWKCYDDYGLLWAKCSKNTKEWGSAQKEKKSELNYCCFRMLKLPNQCTNIKKVVDNIEYTLFTPKVNNLGAALFPKEQKLSILIPIGILKRFFIVAKMLNSGEWCMATELSATSFPNIVESLNMMCVILRKVPWN